jgi:hypothetical protein
MPDNPLKTAIHDWLPEYDFGVMSHGFAPHGRDYVFIVQIGRGGTHELIFTHVVEMHYETRVRDDVWPGSWDDVLTDYSAWEAAGAPDGYVWGSNWSLAFPGLVAADNDPLAAQWSKRMGRPMYAMTIETDRFRISLIFSGVRQRKLSDESPVVERVLFPLD